MKTQNNKTLSPALSLAMLWWDVKNHGQYVREVVRTANAFLKVGLITRRQWSQTVTSAAHSKCGWNPRSDHHGDRDWHRDWDNGREEDWPTNDTGYQLEATPVLLPATWTPVPGTPAIAGSQFTVTDGPATGIRFYRLNNL